MVAGRDRAWLEVCGGRVRVSRLGGVCHGLAVVVQGEQLLGHALAVLAVVLRCGRLRGEVGDLDGEFGAEEEGEIEETGPRERRVAAGE